MAGIAAVWAMPSVPEVATNPMETGGPLGKVRVLLADDNEAILARVRAVLGKDFDVIGAVNNGRDAIAEARRLDPDVLLMDLHMPVLDGLQAAARMRSELRTKIVLLSAYKDPDFVDAAFAVGARGYVAKSDITSDLVPAILAVLQGHTFVSKSIDPGSK